MPAASYNDYTAVMLALPGTAEEISPKVGLNVRGLTIILRRLEWLRMVHPGGVVSLGPRGHKVAVWMEGEGPRAAGVRVGCPLHPHANHIAFKTLWRALEDGTTVHEMAHETGTSTISGYRMLGMLKAAGRVYRYDWSKDALGRPVARWMLGDGENVRRPRPATAGEKWQRYNRRLAHKALTRMAA